MKYTPEMKEFIKQKVSGKTCPELTWMFNEHFGTNVGVNQIRAYMKNYGLKNGVNTRFKKGHITHNKGEKGICYKGCEKTWFPKGHTPHNHKPVGSERISKDGYIEVKIAEPKMWRLKHNVVWEKAYGKVPKNHAIILLDGNKLNTDISNLKLITRSELLIMNRYRLFAPDADITDTTSNLAKLVDARNKARKRK